MACNILEEILKNCDGNAGGIVKFYINNADSVDSFTEVDGVITGATIGTGVTASQFVEFGFNPNTSNYTENTEIDLTTDSTFYNQTITLQLARREAAKRQKLLLIALGQPELTVIVKDSNGLYWGFGFDNDKVYLTGNEGGSGTAKTDLNGYILTFTCESATPAFELTEATVNSLI